MTAVVYTLADPRTGEVRYVGQTVNLKWRVKHHWKPTSLVKETHVARWLRGLRAAGLRPVVAVLEEVDVSEVYAAEQVWIAQLRSFGCRLTNFNDRGPGGRPPGFHHTEETKAKIKAARALQPNPLLGTKHSEETIRLFREQRRGVPKSPAWRAAISLAMTGKKRGPYKRSSKSAGAQ